MDGPPPGPTHPTIPPTPHLLRLGVGVHERGAVPAELGTQRLQLRALRHHHLVQLLQVLQQGSRAEERYQYLKNVVPALQTRWVLSRSVLFLLN